MSQLDLQFTKAVRNAHYPPRSQSAMQGRVLQYLDEVPDATNKEIARALGVDACSITGRVFELRIGGFVTLSERRTCAVSKERVCAWRRVR